MKLYVQVASRLLGVLLLLAPITTDAVTTEAEYRATLRNLVASLQQQVIVLQAEVRAKRTFETLSAATTTKEGGYFSRTVTMLDSYVIDSAYDVSAIKNKKHRDYFKQVLVVFPDDYERRLEEMAVFENKENAFDAFVETIPPGHGAWLYGVNQAALDEPGARWNTELMVHELAHIISYDEAQTVSKSNRYSQSCESYFTQRRCPGVGSYLRLFVDDFWGDTDLVRAEQWVNLVAENTAVKRYYKTHQTDFVSSYAASGPEEDFAESFMFFVFDIPVSGERAQRKVDFFTQFAALRAVKAEIIVVIKNS